MTTFIKGGTVVSPTGAEPPEVLIDGPGFEGAAYVCSTPIRSRAESHQDALWNGLRTNDLAVVSTDHCPFCMH